MLLCGLTDKDLRRICRNQYEHQGSAHLMFDDDRYYEFMCFDVPKIVRSPGCDHGHDEESRNGQDKNIDILDDYIRTR